jgi:oxygen-independent coproporphyrinogen-3 oxidase
VREIIAAYNAFDDAAFSVASHGFSLSDDEQRRRFVLQGMFDTAGVSRKAYLKRFGSDVVADFPLLEDLEMHGLTVTDAETVRLSSLGLERSDAIGPAFYSTAVHALSEDYQWR